MIKVLVTEDSPVVRGYLQYVLNSDPDIEVIGIAENGEEAVRMVEHNKPDVVTMDIHMPKMDGFEATRQIMETNPVPIVICSASWNPEEVDKTFRTMEAGAVAALEKPRGMGHPDSEASVRELLQTIKLMAGVKVVRRWSKTRIKKPVEKTIKVAEEASRDLRYKIVTMGSSTGGPMVLQTILAGLPKDFPLPIMIVQHIAPGFLSGLGEWLSRTTNLPVHIASDNEVIEPGKVYLAPDGYQMGVSRDERVKLKEGYNNYTLCPSVSYLFQAACETFGSEVIGVLLTGMGRDGAEELKALRSRGAPTIAQDKESSVVHGMPGEAIKLGGATYVLSSSNISKKLVELVVKSEKKK
ncbi:chemotaxis-specific protein-glutamate methyltransferase CheB [bacterium]|nr:chemotaxis-specific protein-glutamate methyltransferase CheB [bacterium]